MRTLARVRHVEPGRIRLACTASPAMACGACSSRRGCALRGLSGAGEPLIEIPEWPSEARRPAPGDEVVVEVGEGELLRAATVAYLVPLAGLLVGPAVARWLAPGSDATALGAALAGLLLGWAAARAWLTRSPPLYRVEPAGPA